MKSTVEFGELTEWQRAEISRHLSQSYAMNFGGLERQESLIFRLPFGDPATVRTEPPAVLLRELAAAAAAGGTVKPPRMSRADATRMSELLRQSADRAGREARDDQVTADLARLWRDWDIDRQVPQDDYERSELVRFL